MIKRLVVLYLMLYFNAGAQSSALAIADSLFANGNYSKAIKMYKSHDNVVEVYDKIAKSYLAIGNLDAALDNYRKSVDVQPENTLVKFEYGKLLLRTKNYKDASKVFEELIYIDYRNPNYHYQMGVALERLNDSTAYNRFFAAYDLDNNYQKAIVKIAKTNLIKRRHVLSHKYIDKGLESYSKNVELISLKAQNYYYQQYYDKAITWFNTLLQLGESTDFIHEKLSISYAEQSNYEKAIEHRLKVLKNNPLDAASMYVIGGYYERLNDFENAAKYISKSLAVQNKPLHNEYRQLGTLYNRQKQYDKALEAFQNALKEDPTDTFAKFYIVKTKDEYYADRDLVKKLYKDFVNNHSESPFARFAKMRLKELEEESFLKED